VTADNNFFSIDPNGDVQIQIKVVPRASADRMEGVEGSHLKVRITAPPVEGKANAHLLRFLAGFLSIRAHQINVISGQNSRFKRIRVAGLTLESRNALVAKLSRKMASD
jgi:uncharacterized protein (TIGR00251 family)